MLFRSALLLNAVDGLVSEMLAVAAALADLLGQNKNLGEALYGLAELFLGANTSDKGSEGLHELARYFAKDDLPEARMPLPTVLSPNSKV